MKKYLFLIDNMSGGGSERVMSILANYLSSDSSVHIVTLAPTKCFYTLNENVELSGLNNEVNRKNRFTKTVTEAKGFIKSFFAIQRIVRDENPDCILSFLYASPIVVLLKKLHLIRCRLVVSERADPTRRSRFFRFYERKMYPAADWIVCQSKQVARFFGDNVTNKSIIKNPISRKNIPMPVTDHLSNRIVAVGRLYRQKRFDVLINAINLIRDQYPDYTVDIYGEGPERDDLQKQIDQLGLTQTVHLNGSKSNVLNCIADARLFVLSSDFEGLPNALIEAMVCGLPVITTDFSPHGVAYEIVHDKNGMVVEPDNPGMLAKAICTLLSSEKLQTAMREENIKVIREYDEAYVIQKWRKVLDGNI